MDIRSQQHSRIAEGHGFIAALDQSGGSSIATLTNYGCLNAAALSNEAVADRIHELRVRVMTDHSFDGDRILGAILFEATLSRSVQDHPTADYLWPEKGIVPFVKVDNGLDNERNGTRIMRPVPDLEERCDRAVEAGVFGTKMRSVIDPADPGGIDAVLDQQFEFASRILAHGLVPIIEPEVALHSVDRTAAEQLLISGIARRLCDIPSGRQVMLKLSLPTVDGLYGDLVHHDRVLRVVALSGGLNRLEACAALRRNPGVIASFSRALLEGLDHHQTPAEFSTTLSASIQQIYDASMA